MKKIISLILLLCTFTMSVTVAAQTQSQYSLEDITFGTEYSYGYPLKSSNLLKGAFTYQDGRPIGVTVCGGNSMVFTVFDLNTMKRLKTFTINRKETNASQIHTSPTGDIYIGTGYASHLYRYSPETKELYDLGSVGSSGTMSMTFDDEGNVYIGTYPDARIVKYDISDNQFVSYGRMDDSKQYITGLQWHDGILYYHHQNVSEGLHTFNPETGEKDLIPFAEGMSSKKCGGLFLRQNKLFYRNTLENGDTVMYIYDLDKKEWDGTIGKTIKGDIVTPVINNKIYYLDSGYFHSYDFSNGETEKLDDMPWGSYLRGDGFFELDDPEMPGLNYMTTIFYGDIYIMNFENRKIKKYSGIVEGIPSQLRDYAFGTDGNFYVGEYQGTKAAKVNLKTGKIETMPMAQPEGVTALGDKVYFGNYTHAELYIYDTTKPITDTANKPDSNPKNLGPMGDEQDRPFLMFTSEDKVIIGTVPTYGKLGGALSIYDPETEKLDVYRNIVKDQMPQSGDYKDGKIYIGTSVSGGLGIYPTETDAKVVKFDMETRTVEKAVDLKIPGINVPIKGVTGISVAPDNTLLGQGYGFIFKMDLETLELLDYKIWGETDYGEGMQLWWPNNILYDESGYAFMSFDNKLAVVDPVTLEYKVYDITFPRSSILGPDGNLYYASTAKGIMMIPVLRVKHTQGGNTGSGSSGSSGSSSSSGSSGGSGVSTSVTDIRAYQHKLYKKVIVKAGSNKATVDAVETVIDENSNIVPVLNEDKMMVPLRFLSENLDFKVLYNDMENTVTVYNDETSIKFKIGSRDIYVNGEYKKLVVAPYVEEGRTFVHIRTFSEIFGKKVYWDESGAVVINKDGMDFDKDKDVLNYINSYFGGE